MIVVIVSFSVALFLTACLMVRNERTIAYRNKILLELSEAAQYDIIKGADWRWRYDEYDRPSYIEMALKFWKPFDSFYPDKSFRLIKEK